MNVDVEAVSLSGEIWRELIELGELIETRPMKA